MASPPLAPRPAKRRLISPPPTRADALLDPDLIIRSPVIRPTRPDTPHCRAPRFLDVAGELLTATLIIAGGVFAYGFIPAV
ncbi:hypothetical protein [Methylobacterium oryzae]|uniref:Protein of unassigned function n=1 Tax=Methylobacterium oryzae CBMB20 TaxID=693986 RepID=A0A089NUT5_9HYPH|nr:hypothetical protein [Methylobacterium oryzae]AIQ91157.1 protein of unassigned function [Methylobacterium oryzae CBMB20]